MKRILKYVWPWRRIYALEAQLADHKKHLRKASQIIALKGGISIK